MGWQQGLLVGAACFDIFGQLGEGAMGSNEASRGMGMDYLKQPGAVPLDEVILQGCHAFLMQGGAVSTERGSQSARCSVLALGRADSTTPNMAALTPSQPRSIQAVTLAHTALLAPIAQCQSVTFCNDDSSVANTIISQTTSHCDSNQAQNIGNRSHAIVLKVSM